MSGMLTLCHEQGVLQGCAGLEAGGTWEEASAEEAISYEVGLNHAEIISAYIETFPAVKT